MIADANSKLLRSGNVLHIVYDDVVLVGIQACEKAINNVLCIPANTFEQWKSNIDNIEENLDAGDYDAIMSAAERAILRREIGRWRVQLNNIFNRRP